MKRKADAAYICNICSRKGVPRCFASDHALARHKHSASHMQQHRVALAIERGRSVAPPPLPDAHAEHQQVKHESPRCKMQPMSCGDLEHQYCRSHLSSHSMLRWCMCL